MRIPTSVIVMSVVTAMPFGLAIRDTLRHKGEDLATRDDFVRTSGRAREEELMREMEREEAARAEEREQRLAKLDAIYGARPASFGTLLDGIVLGADAASFEPEAARERIERIQRDGLLSVNFDVDEQSLRAVTVVVHGSDYNPATNEVIAFCSSLRERLVATWGPSTNGVWTDAQSHYRARIDTEACSLTFERYLDASDWVASVSPNLVGAKADPILDAHSTLRDSDGQHAMWQLPGIGAGRTHTTVDVSIAKGKITELEVHSSTDFDSSVRIREQLTEILKVKPTEDPETGGWVWKRAGKLPVQMYYDPSGSLSLYVVKP